MNEIKKHLNLVKRIMFISTDHIRFENGIDVSGHNYNCKRGIKIEPNIEGGEGYSVTIYNMDGNHPVWGNNVQMSPKQMRIESATDRIIKLRGYGSDAYGSSFADYGITIYFEELEEITKVILHMIDRNIDIEYFK